jgi:hypothetical protein
MKPTQNMTSSHRMKLLAVILPAVWCCPLADAAVWDKGGFQTNQMRDLDGDGIPNVVDPDVDNDGIPNLLDRNIDGGIAQTGPYAGKHLGDHTDNDNPSEEDLDDDGLADDSLGEKDIDGDGKLDDDPTETDTDGDGRNNGNAAEMDIDSDGRKNTDASENDGDGDGKDDIDDEDDDNNGVRDIDDEGHQAEDEEAEVYVDLDRQSAAPSESTIKATLQKYGNGDVKFLLDARDLAVGSYQVSIGGAAHGTLVVVQENSRTQGVLAYKSVVTNSGDLLLDFPVASQPIEISQGATIFFSGTAPAMPAVGPEEGNDTISLTRSPGVSNEANAEATLHFENQGPTELEINIEKLPAGDYEIVIGDATRGTLTVSGSPGVTSGTLQFKVDSDPLALPLNFPCAGQPISVVQGANAFFFGQLPENSASD